MIYVGIDDTDVVGSPGTNQLARLLVAAVAGDCLPENCPASAPGRSPRSLHVEERFRVDYARTRRRYRGRRCGVAPARADPLVEVFGERPRDADAVEFVAKLEVDGIFLDTLSKGAAEFRARLEAARPGVILESEGAVPLENLHDHHASWAQWFGDSHAPGVLRHKWLERRHMQHQIRRWDYDHTAELQAAWMNGSGMMVWENVFGSWVGWNARDRSLLRAILPIQRHFADLFAGEAWTPLVPTEQPAVYGSEWTGEGVRLWTLVNG